MHIIPQEETPAPVPPKVNTSSTQLASGGPLVELYGPNVRLVSFDDNDASRRHAPVVQTVPMKPMKPTGSTTSNAFIAPHSTVPSVEITCYWCSNEAVKLFAPKRGETAEGSVNTMITKLENALNDQSKFGSAFAKIVEGGDLGLYRLNRTEQIKIIRKAQYVCAALKVARDVICSQQQSFSFGKCCQEAAQQVSNHTGARACIQGTTIARWYREFRRTRTFAFPAGKKYAIAMRQGIIDVFHQNPRHYATFSHFMGRYLRVGIDVGLATGVAFKYFNENVLPQAARDNGFKEVHFYLSKFGVSQIQRSVFEAWYREILVHYGYAKA